jgi:hypothetical protein
LSLGAAFRPLEGVGSTSGRYPIASQPILTLRIADCGFSKSRNVNPQSAIRNPQ